MLSRYIQLWIIEHNVFATLRLNKTRNKPKGNVWISKPAFPKQILDQILHCSLTGLQRTLNAPSTFYQQDNIASTAEAPGKVM